MTGAQLLRRSRLAAGLTQDELARLAHTSRTTLSAYEHGRKSPTLDTATRLLAAAGHELDAARQVLFETRTTGRGRPFVVPDALWRLPLEAALAVVELPLHLAWSTTPVQVDLADRRERARCYETVLVEGTSADLELLVDGALLVDLWSELVLPRDIRSGWDPLITATLGRAG